jgi:hypothetical protein
MVPFIKEDLGTFELQAGVMALLNSTANARQPIRNTGFPAVVFRL